jgi:hypothetical protein
MDRPLGHLAGFYEHLQELATNYVREPAKLEEQLQTIRRWQEDVAQLRASVSASTGGISG